MDKRVWIGYCAGTVKAYCTMKYFRGKKELSINIEEFRTITRDVIGKTRFDEEDIMELSAMVLARMQSNAYEWDSKFRLIRYSGEGV